MKKEERIEENDLESTGLRDCPFCGGKAVLNKADDGGIFINCAQCQASSMMSYPMGKDEAQRHITEAWNERVFDITKSDRWFRALQRELDTCKAQRDRLLEACKLVMDYEAIHLNGGIGYCIAIKTSALNTISELVREAEAYPTPEITDNLP